MEQYREGKDSEQFFFFCPFCLVIDCMKFTSPWESLSSPVDENQGFRHPSNSSTPCSTEEDLDLFFCMCTSYM